MIQVAFDVNRAVLLVAIIFTLGLGIADVDDVIADFDPNKTSKKTKSFFMCSLTLIFFSIIIFLTFKRFQKFQNNFIITFFCFLL